MQRQENIGQASEAHAYSELTAEQLAALSKEYEAASAKNDSLLEEVIFILNERIEEKKIKIHAVEGRIKKLESLIEKCKRNGSAALDSVNDVVGTRVVCLFRSDIERIEKLVKNNFEVVEIDNKIENANNPLGYMSVHYLCKMPSKYKGPRYEKTENAIFEIQIRTLCMHCWAAVSHYLEYKGDWDVPKELKLALGALGGLFYVADNQFEQFNAARVASKKILETLPQEVSQDINLDTFSDYLGKKYPDRATVDSQMISDLILEIKRAGYKSIGELDRDIDRAQNAVTEYERAMFGTQQFSQVGMARSALYLASDKMYETRVKYSRKVNEARQKILEFRHLVKR
jgi:Uncharacterized protein conserved in bacteria